MNEDANNPPVPPGPAPTTPTAVPGAVPPTEPSTPAPTLVAEPRPEPVPAPVETPSTTAPVTVPDEDDIYELPETPAVEWQGAEFVSHDKSSRWYVSILGAAALLAVAVYLITKDMVSSVTIIVVAGMLAFIAGRQPKQIPYRIDGKGLSIGEKQYPFTYFRSYAIMREGSAHSIALHPLQRFMPMANMYFAPENEDLIVEALNDHLPAEEREHDYIDQFLHKIKF